MLEATGTVVVTIVFLSFVNCEPTRLQAFPQYYIGEECLEVTSCDLDSSYRTSDGSCSSLGCPPWARAGTPFERTCPPVYQDNVSSLRLAKDGGSLPNARKISSTLFRDKFDPPNQFNTINIMSWGQLIAHDCTQKRLAHASVYHPCCTNDFQMLSPESLSEEPECLPVEVSVDDPFYGNFNVSCLSFYRATPLETTRCLNHPREQINNISHVIDGSVLYGSDTKTAFAMRSLADGKLKVDMSTDGHAFLTNDSNPAIPCQNPPSEHKCYFAGDERVNQNPGLLVLTTALMRLHNHLCDQMVVINPHWSDERVYQEVRRIIWAFLQHVTYKHYLPVLLGREFVKRKGLLEEGDCTNFHDPTINPAVYLEFSAAAFRSFHALVAREVVFVNKEFNENGFVYLDNFIFRPSIFECHGAFDDLMRGLANQPSPKMNRQITVGLTNFFSKQNRTYGGDLEVFDIMSGRDMGLPPYVKLRSLCDQRVVKDFDDLEDVMTKESIWELKKLYSFVDDVDLFVGGMMETVMPGALVGPTFQCIIGEQFYHFMRGDRFYYENCGVPWSFTPEQMEAIRGTSISWMCCVTGSDIENIQLDTFHKPSSDNPIKPCSEIPHLDISPWIDHDGQSEDLDGSKV